MTEPIVVTINLAGRAYEVLIGSNLLGSASRRIIAAVGRRRLVIVSDETVAALHLPTLTADLDAADLEFVALTVPAGEASKELHRFPALLDRLLALDLDRRTVIVALGGGVVGDLAGFAASCLLRGLDYIQIPTTLLAQIDSSVGGKTGVNASAGKNLVGAFHQPRLVLADLDMLGTLPRRELLAGYGEMVKYGLLGDAQFFELLERRAVELLTLEPTILASAIATCCRMKAEIVAEDEREAGRRGLLNLGHTFGHALEAETGFGDRLLHGEGVAIGTVMAAELSAGLGRLETRDADRIRRHFASVGLPTDAADLRLAPGAATRLLGHMMHDKKTIDQRLNFITLDAIGRATILRDVEPAEVRRVLLEAGVPA
jgi:3-dehydroquinate synthase